MTYVFSITKSTHNVHKYVEAEVRLGRYDPQVNKLVVLH